MKLRISNDYVQHIRIKESFVKNGKLIKYYTLDMWDDYAFNAYMDDNSLNKVGFKFDIDHPLFFHCYIF